MLSQYVSTLQCTQSEKRKRLDILVEKKRRVGQFTETAVSRVCVCVCVCVCVLCDDPYLTWLLILTFEYDDLYPPTQHCGHSIANCWHLLVCVVVCGC